MPVRSGRNGAAAAFAPCRFAMAVDSAAVLTEWSDSPMSRPDAVMSAVTLPAASRDARAALSACWASVYDGSAAVGAEVVTLVTAVPGVNDANSTWLSEANAGADASATEVGVVAVNPTVARSANATLVAIRTGLRLVRRSARRRRRRPGAEDVFERMKPVPYGCTPPGTALCDRSCGTSRVSSACPFWMVPVCFLDGSCERLPRESPDQRRSAPNGTRNSGP